MHPVHPIEKKEQRPVQQVLLKTGKWRNLFPQRLYYNMLARALNICVHKGVTGEQAHFRLEVNGYLFNGPDVFLVLAVHKTQVLHVLRFFSRQLRREIKRELVRTVRHTGNPAARKALYVIDEVRLFVKHPFFSEWLAELVMGKQIRLPYYDAHLEQLTHTVQNSLFCSVVDYSGGIGPVLVKKHGL